MLGGGEGYRGSGHSEGESWSPRLVYVYNVVYLLVCII